MIPRSTQKYVGRRDDVKKFHFDGIWKREKSYFDFEDDFQTWTFEVLFFHKD